MFLEPSGSAVFSLTVQELVTGSFNGSYSSCIVGSWSWGLWETLWVQKKKMFKLQDLVDKIQPFAEDPLVHNCDPVFHFF